MWCRHPFLHKHSLHENVDAGGVAVGVGAGDGVCAFFERPEDGLCGVGGLEQLVVDKPVEGVGA
jgi:hypothetical protein